jgi:hypothetical protein
MSSIKRWGKLPSGTEAQRGFGGKRNTNLYICLENRRSQMTKIESLIKSMDKKVNKRTEKFHKKIGELHTKNRIHQGHWDEFDDKIWNL